MKQFTTIISLIAFIQLNAQPSSRMLNSRGFHHAKNANYHKAISLFTKAIDADPFYTEAYYNRGLAYSRLQQYELAIADYTKAITMRPGFKMAYNNRGSDKLELKDYAGAILDFTQAIKIDSNYAVGFFNRGTAYLHVEDYDNAIKDFKCAVSLRPEYPEAIINLKIAEVGAKKETLYLRPIIDQKPTKRYPIHSSSLQRSLACFKNHYRLTITKTRCTMLQGYHI